MAKLKEVKKQKPRTNTQQMGQNLPWNCKRAGSEVSLAPGCVPTASRCKGFTEWAWTHVFVIHCSRNKLPQVRLGVPPAPMFMFCLTVKMSGVSSHSLDGVREGLTSPWLSSLKEAILTAGGPGGAVLVNVEQSSICHWRLNPFSKYYKS